MGNRVDQQRGITVIGLLFVSIMVIFVAMVAMKLVPAYIEYFEVKKILSDISKGDEGRSNALIREEFSKRASIDNITAVKPSDLEIGNENGKTVITANYTYETKIVGNVSLLVDFEASSSATAMPDGN